ncbi:hypothetical protein N9L68_02190 [bacterium]|nr:hypothetical protein [bacterium]
MALARLLSSRAAPGSPAPSPAAKKRVGRPPKDWTAEVARIVEEFSNSEESDPCYWGPEAKTQIKFLQNCTAEMQKRVKTAKDSGEVSTFFLLIKQLGIIENLVDANMNLGMDNPGFKKIYDLQVPF